MFSSREEEVLKALGSKTLTFGEIANRVFKKVEMPIDSGIKMNNSVKRINNKCEVYGLDWYLHEEKRDRKLVVTKRSR